MAVLHPQLQRTYTDPNVTQPTDAERLLDELSELLQAGDEPRWAARVGTLRADLEAGHLDQYTAREVLRLYGGAGTLGDVVLQPGGRVDAGLNERFDRLRTQLYQLAMQAIEAKN